MSPVTLPSLPDAGRIGAHTRMECGVCWHVYDPDAGDEVGSVPAGTPFSALPVHWRCPNCDGGPERFIVMGRG